MTHKGHPSTIYIYIMYTNRTVKLQINTFAIHICIGLTLHGMLFFNLYRIIFISIHTV